MNRIILAKKLSIKYALSFSLQHLSGIFLILRRVQWHIIISISRSSRKLLLLLSDFNDTWISSLDFRINVKEQTSWKPFQWQLHCSMRMHRQADRRDVANSLKLYNDQCNAQVFNWFIYLLLSYMFRAFFQPIFRGRCTVSTVVQIFWVWCQRPRWHHSPEAWTTADIIHLPLKMGRKKARNV
jgi:hypothetical protein